MHEVKDRHTAGHLKALILSCLEKYGVQPHQVYSITSDNASNLIKSVSLIMEDEERSMLRETGSVVDESGDELDTGEDSVDSIPLSE